ncbi:MAG: amidophosphoribosyltransferase [Treponemataceae bacterium]|nr:amidophosphoribosyltransferase [Treponemataceae bacterium]
MTDVSECVNGQLEDEKLRDKCGVVGIYLNKKVQAAPESGTVSDSFAASSDIPVYNAAKLAYYGMYALQHRGQESAGIAVSDGEKIEQYKDMGLVADVFNAEKLDELGGKIAVGHVLYTKASSARIENAQPFVNRFKLGGIAVAHNGQLVNYEQLKEFLEETGSTFVSSSDTEVIVKLIAKSYKKGLERALTDTIQMIKGSFSLCVMTEKCLIGARDPHGIHPLCLGKLENGWVLASESCALDAIGADLVRDINPGEIVIISDDGVLSFEFGEHTAKRTCVFEYVYFARPDSVIDGIPVQEARLRMGAVLANESGVDADVVIGVPDSGLGAAMGYAKASGIPYAMGIVKNKYIGRTFIAPTQSEREKLVFVKLNAMKSDIAGKRVVIIDDSIVRGTTSKRLIALLRRAGAKEVHFRISSPPVKFPCYFGIDTPSRNQLISSTMDVDELCKEIGADSLAFISIDGMFSALKDILPESYGYCKGCFTGEYPVSVPGELNGKRL